MKTYHFRSTQRLNVSLNEAWDFFSNPRMLARITPPSLDFRILSDFNGSEIYEGMVIQYRVRPLFGIPVRWVTVIGGVEAPYRFTDRQLSGPYSVWNHHHTFREAGQEVEMVDEVEYALPFGLLGRLVHFLIVRRKIRQIFEFRRQVISGIFGKSETVKQDQ